ncbi:MAG: signal peptidase I [Anaerolineales bacterium]|nr:signal peptidase I [Anaerolineales bacterium]
MNADFLHTELTPDPLPQGEAANWRRVLLDTLETILLSLILFVAINAISERIRVESISMQPNLYEGDFVYVNKLAYRLGGGIPRRGDVIVFQLPLNPNATPYIKRVIGLPGDQVHIADGQVYINGEALIEPYLIVSTNRGGDWTIPEGAVFVMGDNRNNSSDSRAFGVVTIEYIIGRAEFIYWPIDNWAALHINTAVAAPEQ